MINLTFTIIPCPNSISFLSKENVPSHISYTFVCSQSRRVLDPCSLFQTHRFCPALEACLNLVPDNSFQMTKEVVSRSTSEEGTSSSKVVIPPVSDFGEKNSKDIAFAVVKYREGNFG